MTYIDRKLRFHQTLRALAFAFVALNFLYSFIAGFIAAINSNGQLGQTLFVTIFGTIIGGFAVAELSGHISDLEKDRRQDRIFHLEEDLRKLTNELEESRRTLRGEKELVHAICIDIRKRQENMKKVCNEWTRLAGVQDNSGKGAVYTRCAGELINLVGDVIENPEVYRHRLSDSEFEQPAKELQRRKQEISDRLYERDYNNIWQAVEERRY